MSTVTDTAELAALRADVRTLKAANASLTSELSRLQDLRENDPLRLAHVQDAIKAAGVKDATREQQCTAVELICYAWRVRREIDAKEVAAAVKLKHAGLYHLAIEMDWREALQHGQSEILWLVEKLARTTDDHEVESVLVDFHTPGVNEEDTWVLDERE